MSSQELILVLVPHEIGLPQRSDIMSLTAGKSVYEYVGLRTTGTP